MSNDEYQQQQFWEKLEKPFTQKLTLKEIMERYDLTEEQINILKTKINEQRKNNK